MVNETALETGLESYATTSVYELDLTDFAPEKVPREPDSVFQQVWESYQDQFDRHGEALSGIASSSDIRLARGPDLDLIGATYGVIGNRGRRSDGEYRRYLLGIFNAFRGTGTIDDIKFAVSASVLATSPDSVLLQEYPQDLEYSVIITDWESHEVDIPVDIADLADASVVELREPIEYRRPTAEVVVDVEPAVYEEIESRDPAEIILDPSTMETEIAYDTGFGGGYFDGEDPFGEYGDAFGGQNSIRASNAEAPASAFSASIRIGKSFGVDAKDVDLRSHQTTFDPGEATINTEAASIDVTSLSLGEVYERQYIQPSSATIETSALEGALTEVKTIVAESAVIEATPSEPSIDPGSVSIDADSGTMTASVASFDVTDIVEGYGEGGYGEYRYGGLRNDYGQNGYGEHGYGGLE